MKRPGDIVAHEIKDYQKGKSFKVGEAFSVDAKGDLHRS